MIVNTSADIISRVGIMAAMRQVMYRSIQVSPDSQNVSGM